MNVKSAADIYRYTFNPDSNTLGANILRFVGNGKKVLEIGAGPGSLARPLMELNNCQVTAVELDEKSVEILREFCEVVVQHDLNDHSWPGALPYRGFDAVVIADVLEHLYDPWTTLKLAAGLVNDQGSVVVSIPHTSHAAILACLLNNDIDYREWGLLDRTHIRFFGMKNIQSLFDGAGLKIADYEYIIRHPEETEFADAWGSLPEHLRAILEGGEYAQVYQVVVRAVPSDRVTSPGRVLIPPEPARHANGSPVVVPPLHTPPPNADQLKYIAFYLPQFHPIPENDVWWGKGFTEWTNVTKAEPLFEGHYQPHLPTDFGFYDLRVRDVQHQQIAYAKRFGVDAFCFHYYWFGGRKLLQRPVEDFLADPKADMPFCLCWANESWTRRWDGSEHEMLVEQTYSPESDIAFIKSVEPFMRDRRYLRVHDAPVLVVYRPQNIPEGKATAERWRQYCRDVGIGDIHLIAALTFGNMEFDQFGFDAGVEFPPHNIGRQENVSYRVHAPVRLEGLVFRYGDIAANHLARDYSDRCIYRCVSPSWDNTARLGRRAVMMLDGTPENYERWLAEASRRTLAERASGERLVFINAWNEWAEGCHLEPDRRYGTAFLEATLRVKSGASTTDPAMTSSVGGPGLRTNVLLASKKVLSNHPIAYRLASIIYRATVARQ